MRELLLGWIYSGTLRLVGDCPSESEPAGNMLDENFTWHRKERADYCVHAKELAAGYSVCAALKDFRMPLFLTERGMSLDYQNRFAETLWTSPTGLFTLSRLNQERAEKELCSESSTPGI
jgi:hypothetical protein